MLNLLKEPQATDHILVDSLCRDGMECNTDRKTNGSLEKSANKKLLAIIGT